MVFVLLCSELAFELGLFMCVCMCVLMCPWVCPSLQTQPSTAVETQGLQLMASRSWLRDFRWEITCWLHVFNGKAANGKQEQSRMSPGMNNKSTWNISKWRQVRIGGLDNCDTHFKSNRKSFPTYTRDQVCCTEKYLLLLAGNPW